MNSKRHFSEPLKEVLDAWAEWEEEAAEAGHEDAKHSLPTYDDNADELPPRTQPDILRWKPYLNENANKNNENRN